MKQHTEAIHGAGQVKEFKNKTFRQLLQPCSETSFPEIVPEEHGVQNARRRKQANER